MEHTDFHKMYKAIRDKEVIALRNALQKLPLHKYDWDEHNEHCPRIIASPKHYDYACDFEVYKITDNLGYDCGIYLKELESERVIETGYAFLAFGSIDYILDNLPEISGR